MVDFESLHAAVGALRQRDAEAREQQVEDYRSAKLEPPISPRRRFCWGIIPGTFCGFLSVAYLVAWGSLLLLQRLPPSPVFAAILPLAAIWMALAAVFWIRGPWFIAAPLMLGGIFLPFLNLL